MVHWTSLEFNLLSVLTPQVLVMNIKWKYISLIILGTYVAHPPFIGSLTTELEFTLGYPSVMDSGLQRLQYSEIEWLKRKCIPLSLPISRELLLLIKCKMKSVYRFDVTCPPLIKHFLVEVINLYWFPQPLLPLVCFTQNL